MVTGGTGERPDLSQYRRYIESALAFNGGTHTYDDVVEMIAAGQALLWTGPATVCITEIIDHPRKRILNIFLAGGEAPGVLPEMERILPIILDWAREQGCQLATFTGRKGWEKTFLARSGWDFSLVVASREL